MSLTKGTLYFYIKNSQVKMAPKLNAALIHMIDWLGECEYEIYAWS